MIVIGRNGQLARALAIKAANHPGVDICNLARPEIDLEKPNSLASSIVERRPDIVVNAAAWTAVDLAETEEHRARLVNAVSAGEIAKGAADAGAAIIHVSTDYVFDGSGTIAWTERDPVAPVNAYGRTKQEGEELVAGANSRHVIIRTAWLYSPWGGNFLKTMMALAGRDELTVVNDQFGNPTSALDLASAILAVSEKLAATSDHDFFGVYHVAGTGTVSWRAFAEYIFEEMADAGRTTPNVRGVTTDAYPTAARRPANSRLNTAKFRHVFGITMPAWQISARAVIRELLENDNKPDK